MVVPLAIAAVVAFLVGFFSGWITKSLFRPYGDITTSFDSACSDPNTHFVIAEIRTGLPVSGYALTNIRTVTNTLGDMPQDHTPAAGTETASVQTVTHANAVNDSGTFTATLSYTYSPASLSINYGPCGGGTIPTAVHWYRFTENSGTTVADSIASNHATFSGAPTGWSSDHPTSGHSVEFDGNGGLQASSMVSTSTGSAFTIAMWIKIKSLPGHVWCTSNGSGGNAVNSRVLNDPPVKMSLESGADSVFKTISSPVGSWHHFAWVQTAAGSGSGMYLDGSLVDATFTLNGSATGGGVMFGKNFSGGFPLNGWITDIRIWNIALDATQIAAVKDDI